jgi:hypothetical protein
MNQKIQAQVRRKQILNLMPIEEIRALAPIAVLGLARDTMQERSAAVQDIINKWDEKKERVVLTWMRDALRGQE